MQRMLIGAACTGLALALALACAPAGGSVGEPPGGAASADRKLTIQNASMPRPGDRAPVLEIEETLGGATDGNWTGLKGKATVLEFWATWCAPCVQAIPHLNELADELSEHEVRFVSITDEEKGTVAPFLESIPISGLVALDLDRSVFDDYGIQSIPTTFLVDREGVVQAVTRADDVTREALLDLIAGRRPDVAELEDIDFGEFFEIGDEGPEAIFQVLVRPSTKREGGMTRSPAKMTMIAFEPEILLKVTYGVAAGRLLMETELPDQKYDVVVNTGDRPELLEPTIQQAVSVALGIDATWEERVVDAHVLVATAKPKLKPLGPSDDRSFGYLMSPDSLVASDLENLVDLVASQMNRPVFNETGLTGRYKIDLKFDLEKDPESLARAIEETLGLALVPVERTVEMLVVRKHDVRDPQPRREHA